MSLLPVPSSEAMALAYAARLRSTRSQNMPLADAVQPFLEWLKNVRGRSIHTVLGYEADLRLFMRFAVGIGYLRPHDFTFREIELFTATRREMGAAAATTNRQLYALRAFWRFLRREGVATNDPLAEVSGLRLPERLPVYLSREDQELLLEGLGRLRKPLGRRDHAVIATFLMTGIRVAELASLRVEAVDLNGGLLRVIGKRDKQREIPIVPRLGRILDGYLEDVRSRIVYAAQIPWIFVHMGGNRGWRSARPDRPLATRSLHDVVVKRTTAILGRPVHPHALRHSFASRLRNRGADLQEVKELMGHEDIKTTAQYSHITPTRTARLVELLA